MEDLFSVRDQVVAITGGLGRLGRGYARYLDERGARVAILDLEADDEELIRNRFGPQADNMLFVATDVARRASLEAALEAVQSRWGTPHGLVNNAALDAPPGSSADDNGPFESLPESSWDPVLEVNLKGPFLCCQVFGGAMAEAGRGSVVNISSIYGLLSPDQRIYQYRRDRGEPFFKPPAYSASKAAVLNLTRYLATYWAPAVRVNTLTLGGVFDHQDDEFLAGYRRRVPLGRMAKEGEYNGAVLFLLSAASSYMTGSNLVLDGGWTAW